MNTNLATLWLVIGWTMLHFLWVGGVVAAGAAVVLRLLRGASAEVRYAVALASLVLLALVPGAIAWRLARASSTDRSGQNTRDLDHVEPAAVLPAPEAGGAIVVGEIPRQLDRAPALRVGVRPRRSRPPCGVATIMAGGTAGRCGGVSPLALAGRLAAHIRLAGTGICRR